MLPQFRIATHPGQVLLAEFLQPLRLTQAELARALHIPLNRVNELVRGKRGITPESALLFSEYFRNSPEFWMNLQTAYDLSRVRQDMRQGTRKDMRHEIREDMRKRPARIARIRTPAKARRRAQSPN